MGCGRTLARTFLALFLPLSVILSAHGSDYLMDETRVLPARIARIDDLTSSLHHTLWRLGYDQGDGSHLLDSPPSLFARTIATKSVATHQTFDGPIMENDVFDVDGELVPSAFGQIFPGDPVKRQMVADLGLDDLRGVSQPAPDDKQDPNLGAPDVPQEEIVVWGRDAQDLPKALKILRTANLGGTAVLPRDFYREVDQLPADGSETIFEYRFVQQSTLDFGDGAQTYDLPYRWVMVVRVRPCIIGPLSELPAPPPLTEVTAILDPSTPLCPVASASWFLPDTELPFPGDEGELCFDVDHIVSLDSLVFPSGVGVLRLLTQFLLPGGGIGAPDLEYAAFPAVLDPGFDPGPKSPQRAYFAARCLMNRGLRLLDTNNPEAGATIVDVPPQTHGNDFSIDYDGVPIETGYQLRHVTVEGLRGQDLQLAAGAFGLADLLRIPLIDGDYRRLVRNVHFIVAGPAGRTEVTLPQLLQLIQSKWDKAPAYVPPHDLIADHPRIDLGQQGDFVFELQAEAKVGGRFRGFRPIRAIVSAYPGLFSTTYWGGDPFR